MKIFKITNIEFIFLVVGTISCLLANEFYQLNKKK